MRNPVDHKDVHISRTAVFDVVQDLATGLTEDEILEGCMGWRKRTFWRATAT